MGGRLVCRQLDHDLVVFDENSGHTHFLAAAAASLFLRLRFAPEPLDALALRHSAGADQVSESLEVSTIEEILDGLAERGLIEKIR